MKKYSVAIILSILFLHHVICTILYNMPVNPLTSTYQRYVANYMEPFFTQKWLLFAPEPATSDLKLWYKYSHDTVWTSWLDPLEPILKKHQNLRFTYNAKLLYVYGNIARGLSVKNGVTDEAMNCENGDVKCKQIKNDSISASPEFNLAKEYVIRDIRNSNPNAVIDSIQIMLIQLYPRQFSERLSNKPFGRAGSVEFPPVSCNDN